MLLQKLRPPNSWTHKAMTQTTPPLSYLPSPFSQPMFGENASSVPDWLEYCGVVRDTSHSHGQGCVLGISFQHTQNRQLADHEKIFTELDKKCAGLESTFNKKSSVFVCSYVLTRFRHYTDLNTNFNVWCRNKIITAQNNVYHMALVS